MPDKPVGMGEDEKWEALLKSIRRAAKILNIDLTERDLPDYLNWVVASDMNKNLWARVYRRRKAKVGNPIDKSKIRGELVRLKTDMEEHQHDIGITGEGRPLSPTGLLMQHEDIYRETVERAMADMANCDLKGVFLDLEVMDNSALYLMRQNHDIGNRIATIEQLLKDAIIEIANEKCQCKFQKEA